MQPSDRGILLWAGAALFALAGFFAICADRTGAGVSALLGGMIGLAVLASAKHQSVKREKGKGSGFRGQGRGKAKKKRTARSSDP